jgi:invasion protein IalB
MQKFTMILAAAATLAILPTQGMLAAQEAPAGQQPLAGDQPTAPEAAPGAAPEAAPEAVPPAAQPGAASPDAAAADPAAPEIRIKLREKHGDWEVRCAPDDSECFMYQLARDARSNPVAEINLVRLAGDSPAQAGVTVLTPLGTLLRPGLAVQIDEEQRRSYPFTWCDAAGCFARFALDEASVAAYRQGSDAKLTLFSIGAPGTPVELNVSLSGFTAAYDALQPIKN